MHSLYNMTLNWNDDMLLDKATVQVFFFSLIVVT